MLRRLTFCAAVLLLCALVIPPVARAADAPRHAITHEDVWLMKRVGAQKVSPDGRWTVFTVAEPAYEDERRSSDLWIAATDARAAPRRLTASKGAEGDVEWSPDSRRIAFTAKREGDEVSQIYVLPVVEGGEAIRISNAVNGARAPLWSPDGRQLLFVSNVFPGTGNDADNRKAADERKARKYNARAYDSFPVRHWDRWLDERQPTLLVQAADGSGEARDLLAGSALRRSRGYSGRLGNEGEALDAAWTPNGRSVIFAATTDRDASARADVYLSLWQVSLAGGEPKRLTGPEGDYSAPAFTSDGAALLARFEPVSTQYVYNASQLIRWRWPALDQRRRLASGFDESIGTFAIAPGGRQVYFLAERAAHDKLFVTGLDGGPATEVGRLEAGSYSQLSVGGSREAPVIGALWGSAVQPPEVGRVDAKSGRWTALSTFNAERTAQIDWQPLREFWFTSSRGVRIHNLVALPPQFDPSKKYPLFVVIHGGPHSMFKDEFGLRWNYHLLARPGYVVLLTNYSGSTGYGESFARRIQGDPLHGPADELNAAADEAIKLYPFIDAGRQAAGGASYGGHLTNWLAVTTDRYKALVSHAGLFDLRTQWTSSDTVYSRERNAGGPAWDAANRLWQEQSPFYRSARLHTPILLTFGEKDFRVPLNNGIEFWTVLQRQNVPSRLVVFPDANHWILKGEDSRYFYKEVQDWLAKYL